MLDVNKALIDTVTNEMNANVDMLHARMRMWVVAAGDSTLIIHWLLQLESYFLGQCPISNMYTAQTFNENVIIKCRAVMIMILNDCDTSAISLSINPGQL